MRKRIFTCFRSIYPSPRGCKTCTCNVLDWWNMVEEKMKQISWREICLETRLEKGLKPWEVVRYVGDFTQSFRVPGYFLRLLDDYLKYSTLLYFTREDQRSIEQLKYRYLVRNVVSQQSAANWNAGETCLVGSPHCDSSLLNSTD